MDYKAKIKKAKNKIKKDEQQKYDKRTAKTDKKLDALEEKARENRNDVGFKLTKRSWQRGLLWFIQAWFELMAGVGITMYSACSILPEIGNNIGHAVNLSVHSSLIDQVNLMFIPTAFVGVVLLITELVILKWLWQKMNKYLGRLRYQSEMRDKKDLGK